MVVRSPPASPPPNGDEGIPLDLNDLPLEKLERRNLVDPSWTRAYPRGAKIPYLCEGQIMKGQMRSRVRPLELHFPKPGLQGSLDDEQRLSSRKPQTYKSLPSEEAKAAMERRRQPLRSYCGEVGLVAPSSKHAMTANQRPVATVTMSLRLAFEGIVGDSSMADW